MAYKQNTITWAHHLRTTRYIESASDEDLRRTYVEGLLRLAGGDRFPQYPPDLADHVAMFLLSREVRRRGFYLEDESDPQPKLGVAVTRG